MDKQDYILRCWAVKALFPTPWKDEQVPWTQMFLLVLLFIICMCVMLSGCKLRSLGVIPNLSMSKPKIGLKIAGCCTKEQRNPEQK